MNVIDMAQEWLDSRSFGIGGGKQREEYQETINEAARTLNRASKELRRREALIDTSELESVTIHNLDGFKDAMKSVEARLKQKLFRDE